MKKEKIINTINEKRKYANYLKDMIGDRPAWMSRNNAQYLLELTNNEIEKLTKELNNIK